jgi:hypothetical protein
MSTATLPQGDWIRGISIQQPHTTCILTGAKGIEHRPAPEAGAAVCSCTQASGSTGPPCASR